MRHFLFPAAIVIAAALPAAAFENYGKAAFDAAVASGKPVVVHVHAEWCPVCKAQEPHLQSLEQSAAFRDAKFIRVNFDLDGAFKKAWRVQQQSTIIVFNKGKETARFGGTTDGAEIKKAVTAGI